MRHHSVALKEVNASEWLDEVLGKALAERASDIHIAPTREGLSLRLRIDGMLEERDYGGFPALENLSSRIKILANLDITVDRRPQDGHFEITDEGKEPIDVRVSFMPTIYGEAIVMRLLNRRGLLMDFPQLGFSQTQLGILENMVQRPNGMIFVTGPSGSGKTTLLYALLRRLNVSTKSILTLEDPVEYQLGHIRQTQVGGDSGPTFAEGLRAFLRQDPDVIMVGEIRDEETAEIASRAALTGHLVLSTLHANSALGVIVRLTDIGVGKATIASSLAAVISRRLVRTICTECREEYTPQASLLKRFNLDPRVVTKLQRGKGCSTCHGSGYYGRIGIHEIIPIDGQIRSVIMDEQTYTGLVERIRKEGVKSLRQDGIDKVLQGITTLEEVLRVTEDEEESYHKSL